MLSRIEISHAPTYTTYTVGESFDPTGMVVTAHYTDGTSAPVTDYTFAPSGALELTDTKVTVSYGGKTADVAITVLNNDYSIASVVVEGVNAVKDENDDWSVTLPAGTTSVSTISVTMTDENARYELYPETYPDLSEKSSGDIVAFAEDDSHTTYHLTITVAEE